MANKFTTLMNSLGKGVQTHAPEILTGMGVAGMITTVILSVKATPKALDILEAEENKKGDTLTAIEKVQTAWKPYVLPATIGVVSTACIICGQTVNLRRNAVLATAYKLSETAYREYKETVLEELGEKKEKVIREKVAEKQVANNPVKQEKIIITGEGNYLCMDSLTGTYFMSNQNKVMAAINDLNTRLNSGYEGLISVNEYLLEIGCRAIDIGNELVWDTGNKIDVTFTTTMSNEDCPRPCMVISHYNQPVGRRSSFGDLGRYY